MSFEERVVLSSILEKLEKAIRIHLRESDRVGQYLVHIRNGIAEMLSEAQKLNLETHT